MYHEIIGCTPFCCLYRRDLWPSTLVPPAYQATAEALPDTTYSNIKEKDLDSNKEVLGPLLDKNGDGRQAAKQKCEDEDNQSIASGAPTTTDKDRDMSFNLGDSSNQILTAGESLAKEDQNFKGSIIYSATGSDDNDDDDDNNDDDDDDFSKSV